jgi:hypothetical protein
LQKGKKLAKIIIDSADEVTTPKPRKAKTSGTRPIAGLISVEVRPSKDCMAKTIVVLRQQNQSLWWILDIQKPLINSVIHQIGLGKELVLHVGQIADALEGMGLSLSSSRGLSEYLEPEPSPGEDSGFGRW